MADAGAPPSGGAFRGTTGGRARRVRNVAVWSVALFVASVPVAIISASLGTGAEGQAGSALALLFWLCGFATAVWAFVLGFRHWDTLPLGTRWLACLPLLVVFLLIAASVLVVAMI
ncbi:MauE/DoxX family redox-associated membrane protein [Reyranella sp. CPCC 100927]|uniref:MauE/DoxX family redox-associated membrane protein n=1 Tax=Reyranella sp. CPCC 100927 TaxID=2599616 RepID=UPI0011B7B5E6|nr:MauE/DoxX family redox-associated membrane protein [Reyranella sp. CPCC 100927]TWT10171.1 hypothetical protein FQU96_18965 [Reyranella sp. CPCC 100927]